MIFGTLTVESGGILSVSGSLLLGCRENVDNSLRGGKIVLKEGARLVNTGYVRLDARNCQRQKQESSESVIYFASVEVFSTSSTTIENLGRIDIHGYGSQKDLVGRGQAILRNVTLVNRASLEITEVFLQLYESSGIVQNRTIRAKDGADRMEGFSSMNVRSDPVMRTTGTTGCKVQCRLSQTSKAKPVCIDVEHGDFVVTGTVVIGSIPIEGSVLTISSTHFCPCIV
jgi:hypothetical protein